MKRIRELHKAANTLSRCVTAAVLNQLGSQQGKANSSRANTPKGIVLLRKLNFMQVLWEHKH